VTGPAERIRSSIERLSPLLLLACGACAPPATRPATPAADFRVAIFGDMPYTTLTDSLREPKLAGYRAVLDTIAAEPVAFVVHVGDITGTVCSDSMYAQRVREFAAVPHPLIYTPGDNEWTDCARDGYEAMERLARVRSLFAPPGESLGARKLPLERQDRGSYAGFPENARWRMGGVLFLTLHVVGSNNNRGTGTEPGAEYTLRNAADLAWLRESFALAGSEGARGVAVFMQANPWLQMSGTRPASPGLPNGFTELVGELQRLAIELDRPVAVVHGDTHYFRVDQPLLDPRTGHILTTLTRVETYGDPNSHAVLMTVDPASPNLFRFEPLLARTGALR
jgi:hypothetical protein